MAQPAKPTDKQFDPKSIPKWGTQVPPVTTATCIKDFTDFGRSLADAQDVSSRHNSLLVDGFAQPPFKGAFGEKVAGTGLLPEARVAKGRNYANLVVMRGLGTAKDWVLFDFKRGWPKALKQPPALFVKFQAFKPGNKRVVLFNEGSGNVTLKSTPMCLERKGVDYTKRGPKIVEAADVRIAVVNGSEITGNAGTAGGADALTSASATQDGLIEASPKKQSATALSAARKMAAAVKSDQAPESALRSTLRKTPVAATGNTLSGKPNSTTSNAIATMPIGGETQRVTSGNTITTITTGGQAKKTSRITRNPEAATSNAEDIARTITRSGTSCTDITIETGSSTAKTASVKSTISESSMSSAPAELSEPEIVQKMTTAKARKAKQAVELKETLPTKSYKKRKAEAEASSSDTLELLSSSTAAEERSSTPPTEKQKITDTSATAIATVEASDLPVSASAAHLIASKPTITAPPSLKKRNKRHDVPPRQLPAREGRGKNSGLNTDMVSTLESIEPTDRKRKAAAVKEEMVEEPVAKKMKMSAATAVEIATAPPAVPVKVERKSSRAASITKTVPKGVTKKNTKPQAAKLSNPAMNETSSADMLDAALRIVATKMDATSAMKAGASKKITKKSTALSAESDTVKTTTKKVTTSTNPIAAKPATRRDYNPALPLATKKSTRKQAALPVAPPSPAKKPAKKQGRKEGTTVGVDMVIKGRVAKIRQRAPPKPKQTPVNVVESESGSGSDELEP
nr:hypothetical protein B0A51_05530 [Rachicladosporium sp. CCFEE 5018]